VVSVIGGGGHKVTLTVDVTKIAQVKVGQQASVLPDGTSTTLPATVSAVGVAPTTSGATAYAVTLALPGNPRGLRDGTNATVSITTKSAANGLAVPSSAVSHLGSISIVRVLVNGTPQPTRVTVGATGAVYTQILSGLKEGQKVVLADASEPVPTSDLAARFGRIAGAGGLGGGGLGGGGFGGAGGPRPGGG
jgi:HlyD family secretion protein